MKIINITIFVFLFVIQAYSLPNGVKTETEPAIVPEAGKEVGISPIPYTTLEPQPPDNTTTTVAPSTNTTTTSTTTEPPKPDTTTPSTTTSSTTVAPNTTTEAPKTTTQAPNTTTLAPNTTTLAPNVTTVAPTTLAPATTTVAPHSHTQRFDFPSFIGGIMLTLGLLAIGIISHKFYKARTDRNYHTL
ncbi:integumentary mucin C.1-like isoform X2 [Chrysoperla carnea]|uniref:integumentary mucin C.1-like isoform X2 n=1 Tax=Chrysoperla carnea TaxID=189513 RepID=UPI001D064B32|nr:integumentary mucin C.1-like isoform X2 [Chrysoperla carnea]